MKEKMRLAPIVRIPGIGVVASWWGFTCVAGCLDIYIWALSAGYVVWVVRWALDG